MQRNLTERTIRSKLANYLVGRTSLRKFYDWFVTATWDIHLRESPQVQELVYGIKLLLAEYSYGHWKQSDLNRKLATILGSYDVQVGKKEDRSVTTSFGQDFCPPGYSSIQTRSSLVSV
jgi:hypothetical protein